MMRFPLLKKHDRHHQAQRLNERSTWRDAARCVSDSFTLRAAPLFGRRSFHSPAASGLLGLVQSYVSPAASRLLFGIAPKSNQKGLAPNAVV